MKAKATKLLPKTIVGRVHRTHPDLLEPRDGGSGNRGQGNLSSRIPCSQGPELSDELSSVSVQAGFSLPHLCWGLIFFTAGFFLAVL